MFKHRISKRSITEDAEVSSRSAQMRIWRDVHSAGYLKSQDFPVEIADGLINLSQSGSSVHLSCSSFNSSCSDFPPSMGGMYEPLNVIPSMLSMSIYAVSSLAAVNERDAIVDID